MKALPTKSEDSHIFSLMFLECHLTLERYTVIFKTGKLAHMRKKARKGKRLQDKMCVELVLAYRKERKCSWPGRRQL